MLGPFIECQGLLYYVPLPGICKQSGEGDVRTIIYAIYRFSVLICSLHSTDSRTLVPKPKYNHNLYNPSFGLLQTTTPDGHNLSSAGRDLIAHDLAYGLPAAGTGTR